MAIPRIADIRSGAARAREQADRLDAQLATLDAADTDLKTQREGIDSKIAENEKSATEVCRQLNQIYNLNTTGLPAGVTSSTP
jgi:hypothetical protein